MSYCNNNTHNINITPKLSYVMEHKSNKQSVQADGSDGEKMSVKACEHVTKVSRHDGTTWCNGCHERSQNGFVIEFDYNTMQYEVVKA